MSADRDYVLGTHDQEIERLGLQHRVCRRQALEGWLYAGFTAGQTIVDVGCGPGYAALDLAEIVGPAGRIVAIDRSSRFLQAARAAAASRNIANVETFEADLDTDVLPNVSADGAWVRWVFAFTTRPKQLVAKVRALLRTGAAFVIHEYFDYATWRLAPPSPLFDQFVATVMRSWRDSGGEPDIGLQLPQWLTESGFTIRRMRPIIDFVSRRDFVWQWPATFVEVGLERLVALRCMTLAEAHAVREDLARRAVCENTIMVTPAVVEIVAVAA